MPFLSMTASPNPLSRCWRTAIAFCLAIMVSGQLWARCSYVDPDSVLLNVAEICDLDADQVRLMPPVRLAYEAGRLALVFQKIQRPCSGPMCDGLPRQSLPTQPEADSPPPRVDSGAVAAAERTKPLPRVSRLAATEFADPKEPLLPALLRPPRHLSLAVC